jgi:cytochrome c553
MGRGQDHRYRHPFLPGPTPPAAGLSGARPPGVMPTGVLLVGVSLLGMTLLLPAVRAQEGAMPSGADIYVYCVDCHGKRGEGGKDGTYPRIAGLPQAYLDRQLHAFKSQTRVNKPMVPIFKHNRFDAEIIDLVAGHVAGLSPPTLNLWPYTPDPEALAAYPDKSAYVAAGEETYAESCAGCHGVAGEGASGGAGKGQGGPPLVNQYPAYLIKQIGDFARGGRTHAQSERCADLTPAGADAVVNHLVELGK